VEPDLKYVSNTIVPELLNRFLAHSGRMDYDATVSTPEGVIFESAAGASARIGEKSDGSVRLWGASPGSGPRPGPGFHGSPGPREPDGGRMDRGGGAGLDWTLRVRHKAGSLEALVEQARQRNLALSAGLLLLIVATVAALVRFSRQAQRLAELQMHFVAGVSHELRTPLTVIRTAAYNLRGRLAERPEQVERYGQLIEGESKKLDALVEQVLQFASARAGLAIRHLEPVAVEELIDKALEPSAAARRQAGVTLEKRIAADLPPVLADGLALRHALQNLIDNALKYGADTGKWIGVSASSARNGSGPAVEICIADRGPGIPPEEQQQIFDPFFRGRRAVSDQIHGTGLGLDLVKRIVDAHGGTVQVKSAAGKPTEFVLRIPAA
jgi:signal transduction histidine kinase